MEYQEFDSVWDALEPDPIKAEVLKLQATLLIRLQEYLKEQGLTQKLAAKKLGVTQPRISEVMRGKLSLLGLNTLIEMAIRAGLEVSFNFNMKKAA